jgi:pyruvate formate lyase activating enzyme
MDIRGFIGFTTIDFPGVLACEIFCGGCNMRCPFCHNGHLVFDPEGQPQMPDEEVFGFLEKRRGLLEGIVVSGGEPTLQNDLPEFLEKCRNLGYLTKVDTNGARPEITKLLIERGLVDMFAIDWKATLPKYDAAAGVRRGFAMRIVDSLRSVLKSEIRLEVRTTAVKRLHARDEFALMREELDSIGVGAWIIQPLSDAPTIDPFVSIGERYTVEELIEIAEPLHDTVVRNA